MASREDDLSELAAYVRSAMAKARQLDLPTSAYILSMVLVEVSDALKTDADKQGDDGRDSV